MQTSVTRGRCGETIAAAYLELHGYRIVARNRRVGPLEIDLVARRGDVVVFAEVRLRSGRGHGPPEASIGPRKRALLWRAARRLAHEWRDEPAGRIRIDVIAITVQGLGLELRHLPGAAGPRQLD